MRCVVSWFCIVAIPALAIAQPEPPVKDGKAILEMTLYATPAPQPLSRYYLQPEYGDQQPGEQLGGFLKSFMEQDIFMNQENQKKRVDWLALPLEKLPKDIRQQAGVNSGLAYEQPKYSTMMTFIDQAARYSRVEWNEYFNLRKDGAYFLLPEVQKLRSLGFVLCLRLRGEIKNGEFLHAIETIKSLFGLARMLEKHPTLIGNLVSMAIIHMAMNTIEEMIQQPGCPNLYWSLTDLPNPVIDIRTGLAGERVFMIAQFRKLLTADRALSQDELYEEIRIITELVNLERQSKPNPFRMPQVVYATWAVDKERIEAGRKRLVEFGGLKEEAVKSFSPLQVAITDDLIQFKIIRDETFKSMNLPAYQIKVNKEEEENLKKRMESLVISQVLLPLIQRVKQSQSRLDQRVAALRIIEAIRLYADSHQGKLPATLSDIKLPLPIDPATGESFTYKVEGDTAILFGQSLMIGNPQYTREYRLKIAQSAKK